MEALRAQQLLVRELQQKLVEQQEALLSQQKAILEQQRGMYEQMDVVKAQYGLLSDALKQVSFRGLQGELQSYFESHLAGLQNQARGHVRTSHAVDKAPPKAMDVIRGAHFPQPLLACSAPCGQEEYCDFQKDPPRCQTCTACPPGFFLISQCSATADRMCQVSDGSFRPSARSGRANHVSCLAGQGRMSGAAEDLRRAGQMSQHSGWVRRSAGHLCRRL